MLKSPEGLKPALKKGGSKVKFSLGNKFLIGVLIMTLVPLLVITIASLIVSSQRSSVALVDASVRQLVSVRDAKKRQIENELTFIGDQLQNLAQTAQTAQAMTNLSSAYALYLFEAKGGLPLEQADLATYQTEVTNYYQTTYAEEFSKRNAGQAIDTTPFYQTLQDTSRALQYTYIITNPNALGNKDDLQAARDGSSYSNFHAQYHKEFEAFTETFGYYDLFLVEPTNGYIVYSVEKENDFSTSLISGPYADTPIGRAFRLALDNASTQDTYFSDAGFYAPSYNSNEMFAATPIYQGGNLIGILMVQVPVQRIDAIMTNDNEWVNFGLGQSGETYLVGPDKTLRSNSRFLVEDPQGYFEAIAKLGVSQDVRDVIAAKGTASGRQLVNTVGVSAALSGETGNDRFNDYRNVPVFSAYAPINIKGLNWAIMSEIDVAEVLQYVTQLRRQLVLTTVVLSLILLALASLVAYWLARRITRPLTKLSSVADTLSKGDLSQLSDVKTNDELGQLSDALNNAIIQLRESNVRQEEEIKRGQRLQGNIGQFLEIAMDIAQGDLTKRGVVSEDALGNVVDAINLMVEEIGFTLKDVQNVTESVNQGVGDMFYTTDQIAQSAQVQSQGAEQARREVEVISTSIQQMAQTAGTSAQVAERALQASQEGRQAVSETLEGMQDIRREVQAIAKRIKSLGDRSLEISEIVETISRISRQTNLLALNAAIEASSAGEAGSRFAVVADEVRKLAEDSAQSTQRVSSLIKAVQTEVQEVVAGVEVGTREVEEGYKVATQAGQRLEELAAIAQQTAQFAQTISSVTTEQVSRVEQVGHVVEQIAELSEQSKTKVIQGREAAEKLRQLASQLSANIARFRVS
jgi:methyl-accepting chemotaxis protein